MSKDDITLMEQERDKKQKYEETQMKAQQQNFAMSTVLRAIDELRITRGEDAAMEFSSILSHYHLNGVNDQSFHQKHKEDTLLIQKVAKNGAKPDSHQNDSLTQLLDSMTKPTNSKGEEKK